MNKKAVLLHIPFLLFIIIALCFKFFDVGVVYKVFFLVVVLGYGRYYSKKIREMGEKINDNL